MKIAACIFLGAILAVVLVLTFAGLGVVAWVADLIGGK